jgi:hypothetical protein
VIDAALVQQIADCYGNNRSDPAVLAYLRDCFPHVRFTHCNGDEVGRARPVMECNGFNLYLVGGEHCLSLTNQFDCAKGIVIADVNGED